MTTQGHRERDAVEDRSRDLLDEVDLARDVASAPRRDGHIPVVCNVEAESDKSPPLLVRRDVQPDHLRRALRTQVDDGPLGEPRVHVDVACHARSREVDEHAAREDCGGLCEVRIDTLLPAIGSSGAKREPLGRAEDPQRLEVGRLQEHLGRPVGDLAVLAAHDRRERDRTLAVGDEEVVDPEAAESPVERPHLLARTRVPNGDAAAGELRAVEGVERAAPDVHDVVRDVDDVGDRAHVGEVEARSQPLRRRADGDVAEDATDVSRARAEVVDRDVHLFLVDDRRIVRRRRMQLAAEERRDLACEPDHREEIGAVHRRRHVEDLVADREDVDERRPGLGPVGKHHDSGVILPETDLVLGEDHPARLLPTELAFVERLVEDREVGARQRDGNGGVGLEVPGAADDLSRVALPHVDLADAQPVRVGMRPDLEHAPDAGTGRCSLRRPARRRRSRRLPGAQK